MSGSLRVPKAQRVLDVLNSRGRPVEQPGKVGSLEDFYPVMTMLLLPTKREGFPNVVLEAGASNVPTVTMSVTGAVDPVVHGMTGILVAGVSDQAFATAVLGLLSHRGKLRKLGLTARKWVLENYVSEKFLNPLVCFYSSKD